MDFFRNLFGLPKSQPDHSQRFFDHHEEDDSNEPPDRTYDRTFDVFTEPFEMHRYFEQQMDDLIKSFGMHPGFPSFGYFFDQPPAIEGGLPKEEREEEPKNLRDKYLKKGNEKPHYEYSGPKLDKDLDGKLNLGDLDSIFKSPNSSSSKNNSLDLYRGSTPFGGTFFNQSVQVKTIRKADGSLETHRIVRDSQGNEETTVIQKFENKQYTITKKRDKDGKEETHELMENMDEKDKELFEKPEWHPVRRPFNEYFDSSLFNKFFK